MCLAWYTDIEVHLVKLWYLARAQYDIAFCSVGNSHFPLHIRYAYTQGQY